MSGAPVAGQCVGLAESSVFAVTRQGRLVERLFSGSFWYGTRWKWVDHGCPDRVALASGVGGEMSDHRMFVIGMNGDLYERNWNGRQWTWIHHGHPGNDRVVGPPGCAMVGERLFLATTSGKLTERTKVAQGWAWVDHGRPSGTRVRGGPTTAFGHNRVFITGEDGRLFERSLRTTRWRGPHWQWTDHGHPVGTRLAGAPAAQFADRALFLRTDDGRLFEWAVQDHRWIDHDRPPGANVATDPGAPMDDRKLFVGTNDGRLFERCRQGAEWVWRDHGQPSRRDRVSSTPGATMLQRKLFLTTEHGKLAERYWDGTQWTWVKHGDFDSSVVRGLTDWLRGPYPEAVSAMGPYVRVLAGPLATFCLVYIIIIVLFGVAYGLATVADARGAFTNVSGTTAPVTANVEPPRQPASGARGSATETSTGTSTAGYVQTPTPDPRGAATEADSSAGGFTDSTAVPPAVLTPQASEAGTTTPLVKAPDFGDFLYFSTMTMAALGLLGSPLPKQYDKFFRQRFGDEHGEYRSRSVRREREERGGVGVEPEVYRHRVAA